MKIAVVEGTEGNDKFVANLLAEAPTLSKAEVVGMRWLAIADQTRKFCHPPEMGFVTDAAFEA